MQTLDCDVDFFHSTALPQICIATGVGEDLAEYAVPLSDESPPKTHAGIPQISLLISRTHQALIRRVNNKVIFAGVAGFCSGSVIALASFFDHPLPRWIGLTCAVGMVGCWTIAGVLVIWMGRMEPLVYLLPDRKTVRIRFPMHGDAAHAAFRESYDAWKQFTAEAPPAKEMEEPWTGGVRPGWDEAAKQKADSIPPSPPGKNTPDSLAN